MFRRHQLARLVDEAVFSCEVGAAKPDPVIYREVCQRLGVQARNCVYLGDGGSRELEGALHVGMKPVLLKIQNEVEEEGLPPSVANWSGAVIEKFGDIRGHLLSG